MISDNVYIILFKRIYNALVESVQKRHPTINKGDSFIDAEMEDTAPPYWKRGANLKDSKCITLKKVDC